jgi:hypothetical protein
MLGPMTWTPTAQVRALLLLHELSAHLAVEARARTLHDAPQLVAHLAAVGRRALPPSLNEMLGWSALRLAGSRETMRAALEQFAGSSAWAERITDDVTRMLRQGERFTTSAYHLDALAHAIAAGDTELAGRRCDAMLAELHRHREAHRAEDADAAAEAWDPAVERLLKAAAVLGLSPTPTRAESSATAYGQSAPERLPSASSTPYQPSSATAGTDGDATRALRRRR